MTDPNPAESTTPEPVAVTDSPKTRARPRKPAPKAAANSAPTEAVTPESAAPKPPRRPVLDPTEAKLIAERRQIVRRRPYFGRQARGRYFRIGRDESWRRPRGLQSKQRRHYGYRPEIVSIGYRSPALVRGRTPTGFRPVLVRNSSEMERLDRERDAAVIARTVGTRRRLILEEVARKLGVHVLNPIVRTEPEAST
ncbi:Ribosomal protein L32e [mine drainage metagenome]|uniref:Large ribosomal subunit protein eL32 n=1 Tax=mine drainage metagenome TaxID=410659 RepID=T0ZLC7_9ZZZZ